jgi:ribonuclease Y
MDGYGIPLGVLGLLAGFLVAFWLKGRILSQKVKAAEKQAATIIDESKHKAETLLKEAEVGMKETLFRMKSDFDSEAKETRAELKKRETRLVQKEETLDRKLEQVEQRDQEFTRRERLVQKREQKIEARELEYDTLIDEQKQQLEKICGLTSEQAKDLLIRAMENEARFEAAKLVKKIENETKEVADKKAKKILATAIQRYAGDFVAERTVSVVPLPNDEMKGRIIGREGRNIRALEAATGIDLIIDDTPDAVMLSGFDGVRREIARLALTRLIADGRIHPTRIEEVVEKARAEVENEIKLAGEEAAIKANCPGLHPEIVRTLGRLKYRTSYGQNQLMHAVESSHIAAMLAREIGADVTIARRGALLHDLGKAIDREVEGTHALLGADLARRFGVIDAVAHCIESHHEEVQPRTIEAIIVQVADSISGGRPGARMEALESYIKRLEALETVATSFAGVDKAFAIQAGREVRIIVKPEEIDDLESMRLARDVSKKIEETMEYPGQIKVTVVRETRATEYAR